MTRLPLLFLLFLFPLFLFQSCGALAAAKTERDLDEFRQEIDDSLANVADKVADVSETVAEKVADAAKLATEAKAEVDAVRRNADLNGDGKIAGKDELMMAALLGLGGLTEFLRRRGKKATAAQLADVHSRIEHERAKRKAIEQAEIDRLKAQAQG